MATVLAILTSGRKNGYTAKLLQSAIDGIETSDGVEVELVHSHAFTFGPCRSCFSCIRDPEHLCVLDDDMGGKGELFKRIGRANALIIGDPVHNWGPSASARLLIERCYPFLWSGTLGGMPTASVSSASNQGMQRLATAEICKWLFGFRTRYLGGVSSHVAVFDRTLKEAQVLGRALGRAALIDETKGRQKWEDADCFAYFTEHAPWDPVPPYLDNLTEGTMLPQGSMLAAALADGTFKNPEAIENLEKALAELESTFSLYHVREKAEAAKSLSKASAFWTHATWKEFLEDEVIGTKQPEAYRPLDDEE